MKKVLLVEDENLTRNFLLSMIQNLGYEVLACENGEEAIGHLKSFQPNLIITDVMMPEYSGLQLLNYVQKKIPIKIPILLISTLDENVMKDMVADIGAVGFIPKPPTKEFLKEKIEMALSGSDSVG